MKKLLSKWCIEVSIFTVTILVLQVTHDVVAAVNPAIAVLLGLAATALLLAAGLWLAADDEADDDAENNNKKKDADGRGRRIAVRTAARAAAKARKGR